MSDAASQRAKYKLLVVDDDPETARLVRSWYQGRPYEIFEAPDGAVALEMARSVEPDLMLLDLRMPRVDGLTVARTIKTDPRLRTIPIILLTACRDVDDKVEAFSAGADDYVTKPFAFEEVDARIQAMLRRREQWVGMVSTVADLRENNARLEQLLVTDEKTGLHNFREFQRKLTEEFQRAERYDMPLALVLFDIDHFKRLNDTLGHVAGDKALREFATLVAGGARNTDTAARYGGEEFAVILPHTDAAMATRVAERIRAAVEAFVFLADEAPTRMTVSGGVAGYPESAGTDSVDALVRAADKALYEAKGDGRNRIVIAGERKEPLRPKSHKRRTGVNRPIVPRD